MNGKFRLFVTVSAAVTVAAVALLGPASGAASVGKKIEDVTFPATIQPGASAMPLVGAGLRTKWIFKLYALGVYQTTPKRTGKHVCEANEEKFIWLHMLRPVDAQDLREAIDDGLRDNMPPAVREKIAPEVKKFSDALPKVIPKGADIAFWYRPNVGVTIKFGTQTKLVLRGYDTMLAIWSIWFGKVPADASLKAEILRGV